MRRQGRQLISGHMTCLSQALGAELFDGLGGASEAGLGCDVIIPLKPSELFLRLKMNKYFDFVVRLFLSHFFRLFRMFNPRSSPEFEFIFI